MVGIIMTENGAYSYSAGEFGYYNGASFVFFLHALIFWIFFNLFKRIKYFSFPYSDSPIEKSKFIFTRQYKNFLLLMMLFFFLMLFFFGGYKTVLGIVNKGQFRSETIGIFGLGFLAFIITKFFAPSILAYLVFLYKKCKKNNLSLKFKIFLISILTSFIGFIWGFKSSAIVVLLPALVIYLWEFSFKKFVSIWLIFFIIIVSSAYYYDKEISQTYNISPFQLVLYRITVIEGDTFWKVWDLYNLGYIENNDFNYTHNLLNFFGNKFLNNLVDDLNDPYAKIKYSYSSFLTYVVGGNLEQAVSGQYNLTGTIASEGLIVMGFPLMYIFSILGALIAAINYQIIKNSILNNKPKIAAISSSFFVFCTWSWLKGGDIISIIHISNFIGVIFTYTMLSFLEKLNLFNRGMIK
ncbi:MAG: hypothetical protein JHC31_03945 [Sulfurihydrogenibium sp.]|nr:hypothetical protein [Sulfurihydrogenibium sp.]